MKDIPIDATQRVPRRKTRLSRPRLALAVLSILGTLWPVAGTAFAENTNPQEQTSVPADFQRLEGRWVRPDGGYTLALWDIRKDGSLKAAYFNPRQIKVFHAEWHRTEGKINVFVELRDVNYPGSKYNLQYDTATGRLKGTYFQAVERQTYNIEFVRVQ